MKNYWYDICPKCSGQGRLVIRKREDDGELFLQCDECASAWADKSEIGDKNKVFLGFKLKSSCAVECDIVNYGWEGYMNHEYIE